MVLTKQYFVFHGLLLIYLLQITYALQCKTCSKDDKGCILGENVEIRKCSNDNDLCYTWFDRTKGKVGIQRDCISTDTSEYKLMKEMIEDSGNGCVKRTYGLDCFTFCSLDMCN